MLQSELKRMPEEINFPKIKLRSGMDVYTLNAPTRMLTIITFDDKWATCRYAHLGRIVQKRFCREMLRHFICKSS